MAQHTGSTASKQGQCTKGEVHPKQRFCDKGARWKASHPHSHTFGTDLSVPTTFREDREEAARRVLDQEEEQRRARDRLATIKRANSMLQAQTDRMKMMQSQKLLSDVIDVRKKQIKFKDRRVDVDKERDWEWYELQQRQIAEGEAKEKEKAAVQKQRAVQLAKDQKEQLEIYTKNYIEKLKEERLEGELMRQKVEEELIQEKQLEEAKRRQARQNNLGKA